MFKQRADAIRRSGEGAEKPIEHSRIEKIVAGVLDHVGVLGLGKWCQPVHQQCILERFEIADGFRPR